MRLLKDGMEREEREGKNRKTREQAWRYISRTGKLTLQIISTATVLYGGDISSGSQDIESVATGPNTSLVLSTHEPSMLEIG